VLTACFILAAAGCGNRDGTQTPDSAFAALQQRGQVAMGVDQYASRHVFEPLPDGGRIVLQMKAADSAGARVIRDHMRTIAAAFADGDFTVPGQVHAVATVPGTDVMRELKAEILYQAADLDRGGEVRLKTKNPKAIAAIHDFLAFQRTDHRAGMH
jgi:hypothetical protein